MNKLHYLFFGLVFMMASRNALEAKNNKAAASTETEVANQQLHLTYTVFKNTAVHTYLTHVGRMRSKLYKGFPYLYDATIDPEKEDVSSYKNSPDTIMVAAFAGDEFVGFTIGLPLKDFNSSCTLEEEVALATEKFKNVGVNLNTCFYLGEILVEPEYQNKGVEEALYKSLEQEVKATNAYTSISLIHMDRGDSHPLKPKAFIDPEKTIMENNDFIKTGHTVTYSWNTLQPDGSPRLQDNAMDFWVKNLN
jgi:GNAT superfamily N-acetyltransferase